MNRHNLNTIKINEKAFVLPEDPSTLKSVLNHLDMVLKGKKDYIKLIDLEGNEERFATFELQHAKIDYR